MKNLREITIITIIGMFYVASLAAFAAEREPSTNSPEVNFYLHATATETEKTHTLKGMVIIPEDILEERQEETTEESAQVDFSDEQQQPEDLIYIAQLGILEDHIEDEDALSESLQFDENQNPWYISRFSIAQSINSDALIIKMLSNVGLSTTTISFLIEEGYISLMDYTSDVCSDKTLSESFFLALHADSDDKYDKKDSDIHDDIDDDIPTESREFATIDQEEEKGDASEVTKDKSYRRYKKKYPSEGSWLQGALSSSGLLTIYDGLFYGSKPSIIKYKTTKARDVGKTPMGSVVSYDIKKHWTLDYSMDIKTKLKEDILEIGDSVPSLTESQPLKSLYTQGIAYDQGEYYILAHDRSLTKTTERFPTELTDIAPTSAMIAAFTSSNPSGGSSSAPYQVTDTSSIPSNNETLNGQRDSN